TGGFVVLMLFQVAVNAFFNHVVPNPSAQDIRGPFLLRSYLVPVLTIGLPFLVFFTGLSMVLGERTRNAVMVFVLPVATLLVCGFFLWTWSPSWLDLRVNKLFQVIDPAGYRWLNETLLKVDRGVDYYNKHAVPYDALFWLNRAWLLILGIAGVLLTERAVAQSLRGAVISKRQAKSRGVARAAGILAPEPAHGAPLAGKAVANGVVAPLVLAASPVASWIALLVQHTVPFSFAPYALICGLLLIPTFLFWTAFVTAIYAAVGNPYASYGIALSALIYTGFRTLTRDISWAGNWPLWGRALRWSDLGFFETDRLALVLNRVMVLGGAVCFVALAVKLFERRGADAVRTIHRLAPRTLGAAALRLGGFALVPLAAWTVLVFQVTNGLEGGVFKKETKDYWAKNLKTWLDAPLPDIARVDVAVTVDPKRHALRSAGTFTLVNGLDSTLAQIPLTGGLDWNHRKSPMDGKAYEPEDRKHLSLFPPERRLAQGDSVARAESPLNGPAVCTRNTVKGGLRTQVWETDHPIKILNIVCGKWKTKQGHGTTIYYDPAHPYNVEEMSSTLDAARHWYSEWFLPYPWRELKLSEFPALAGYAQGFGTNITFSENMGFLTKNDAKTDATFLVTAHEAAHQWWGNILTPANGPNGDFLSEGMAHFSTLLLFEKVKGARGRMEFAKGIESRYGDRRRVD